MVKQVGSHFQTSQISFNMVFLDPLSSLSYPNKQITKFRRKQRKHIHCTSKLTCLYLYSISKVSKKAIEMYLSRQSHMPIFVYFLLTSYNSINKTRIERRYIKYQLPSFSKHCERLFPNNKTRLRILQLENTVSVLKFRAQTSPFFLSRKVVWNIPGKKIGRPPSCWAFPVVIF